MKIKLIILPVLFFAKICYADMSLAQVEIQLAKALCLGKNESDSYSIAERQALLSKAEQNYDNLRRHGANVEIKKEAQAQWEKIRDYIERGALKGLKFWSVKTNCPLQLEFPNTVVVSNSGGREEALSRAASYLAIGLCKSRPKEFSIDARTEFLQAAAKIYKQLKTSKEDPSLQLKAQRKFEEVQKTLQQINSEGTRYWSVDACPATAYSRSRSGPSLPAESEYPPTAPRSAR